MSPYTPKDWSDGPAGGTPITAAELERIETQYAAAIADVTADISDPSSDIGSALSATTGLYRNDFTTVWLDRNWATLFTIDTAPFDAGYIVLSIGGDIHGVGGYLSHIRVTFATDSDIVTITVAPGGVVAGFSSSLNLRFNVDTGKKILIQIQLGASGSQIKNSRADLSMTGTRSTVTVHPLAGVPGGPASAKPVPTL